MSETEKHKRLKLLGRVLLKDKGFVDTEIYEEYEILIGRKKYVVDICGINPNLYSGHRRNIHGGGKAVAVECGNTSAEKLTNLKLFFDEVVHLPYGIISLDSDLRETLQGYIMTIKSLEKEIIELNRVIRDRESDIKSLEERNRLHEKTMIIAELLKRQADRNYFTYSRHDEKIKALSQILDNEMIKPNLAETEEIPPSSILEDRGP